MRPPGARDSILSSRRSGSLGTWRPFARRRLKIALDRHEIVVGDARREERWPRGNHRGGSRNRRKAAHSDPIELWPKDRRDRAVESECGFVGSVDAVDCESRLRKLAEHRFVSLGAAKSPR